MSEIVYPAAIGVTIQLVQQARDIRATRIQDTITTDEHDYEPTGLDTCHAIAIQAAGAPGTKNITGIAAQEPGRIIRVWNRGPRDVALLDENASSLEANRFALNVDVTLLPDQAVTIYYDGADARWRVMGR